MKALVIHPAWNMIYLLCLIGSKLKHNHINHIIVIPYGYNDKLRHGLRRLKEYYEIIGELRSL